MERFKIIKKGDVTIVIFGNLINVDTYDEMIRIIDKTKIFNNNQNKLVIDLSNLNIIDSYGLGIIAKLMKHTVASEYKTSLVGINKKIEMMLRQVGLFYLANNCKDIKQAIGYYKL